MQTLEDFLHHMLQDLQLRGMSESTQESHVYGVRKISDHYCKTPHLIAGDELREYFLYLKNVKKCGRSPSTLAMCGLKCFYSYTARRRWPTLTLVRAPPDHKLPAVLSQEEVRRLLSAIPTLNTLPMFNQEFKSMLRFPPIDLSSLIV
ncbi:MAG: phage integrase N-terminal SAM-like domain-containing protein [Candidatus Oleimicrobiaceae bacterium]